MGSPTSVPIVRRFSLRASGAITVCVTAAGGIAKYKLPESLAEICTDVQKNTGQPPLRLYPNKTGGYCDRSIIMEGRSGVRDSR